MGLVQMQKKLTETEEPSGNATYLRRRLSTASVVFTGPRVDWHAAVKPIKVTTHRTCISFNIVIPANYQIFDENQLA